MTQRFDGSSRCPPFNDCLLRARLQEQAFARRSDPKAAEALYAGVDALKCQLEQLPALAGSDVGQALADYRQAFDRFGQLT